MAEPKLLFLVSRDYGELTNALSFVRSTGLNATLLLPEDLFGSNRGALIIPTIAYSNLTDVTQALDREQPDIVFLFSGYLFLINHIFDVSAFDALLAALVERRIIVVTSDPFLGMLHAGETSPFWDNHPKKLALDEHFRGIASRLCMFTHIYTAPSLHLAGNRKVSFFNPAVIDGPETVKARRTRLDQYPALIKNSTYWLFVLAAEDYRIQAAIYGSEGFSSLLAARLADALHAGRQPILVAPEACINALLAAVHTIPEVVALSFCAHEKFCDLVMEAEHVFYWNLISNSILLRLCNHLSVHFFDYGHLVRTMPPLYNLAVKTFFDSARPAVTDIRVRLEPHTLSASGAAQKKAFSSAAFRLQLLSRPQDLVSSMLLHRSKIHPT